VSNWLGTLLDKSWGTTFDQWVTVMVWQRQGIVGTFMIVIAKASKLKASFALADNSENL
jgi:hypothetical protein